MVFRSVGWTLQNGVHPVYAESQWLHDCWGCPEMGQREVLNDQQGKRESTGVPPYDHLPQTGRLPRPLCTTCRQRHLQVSPFLVYKIMFTIISVWQLYQSEGLGIPRLENKSDLASQMMGVVYPPWDTVVRIVHAPSACAAIDLCVHQSKSDSIWLSADKMNLWSLKDWFPDYSGSILTHTFHKVKKRKKRKLIPQDEEKDPNEEEMPLTDDGEAYKPPSQNEHPDGGALRRSSRIKRRKTGDWVIILEVIYYDLWVKFERTW